MRSKIASKIISETPPEVRETVRRMSDELVRRHKEVEAVILTDEELRQVIWDAKVAKWNRERNREYWAEQEREVKGKNVDSHRSLNYKV